MYPRKNPIKGRLGWKCNKHHTPLSRSLASGVIQLFTLSAGVGFEWNKLLFPEQNSSRPLMATISHRTHTNVRIYMILNPSPCACLIFHAGVAMLIFHPTHRWTDANEGAMQIQRRMTWTILIKGRVIDKRNLILMSLSTYYKIYQFFPLALCHFIYMEV